MSRDRVLVTGASGFIAKYCIARLLNSGYDVRGTVRSASRRDEVTSAVEKIGMASKDGDHPGQAGASAIEFVEADLNHDGGWQQAAEGCRYVMHLASPFPATEPRNPDDLIKPARDGTLRVLRAAAAAGVERIVQTSSIVAIMQCGKPDHVARTEVDWTDVGNPRVASYARSKTLAERAAWDAIAALDVPHRPEFCTINPGLVLGPAIDTDLSTSHVLLRLLGRGVYPALPKIAFPVVDVRDVAAQHILALTHAQAPGNRFLSCNGTLSLRRVGQLMVEALPDLRRKVPTIELPNAVVRFSSLFDRDLKAIRADLGRANLCDNQKAVTQLGMTFRTSEEAVRSAAKSLRDLGVF